MTFRHKTLGSKYSFFWVPEGGHNVLRNLVQKFSTPKWVRYVVINYPYMVKVKWNILVVR